LLFAARADGFSRVKSRFDQEDARRFLALKIVHWFAIVREQICKS